MRRVPLLLLVAATACWVPVERGRQMEQRIARLEVESEESARRDEEQRALVKDRIATIDRKIEELNQAARRSGADLSVQVARLQEEVAKLRGVLEVDEHRLGEIEKSVAELRSETEGRMAALKGAGALEEYEAKKRIAALPRADDREAFFALAQQEEASGEKGVARAIYDAYVKRWPSDPRSADAGYRSGALLFEARRYREALLAYGKAAETFPKSERAPDALLGVAEAMVRLDMRAEAKDIFEQVVEKYPRSAAAKQAKARMSELYPAARKPA
ncbi:MAG TPA: tetratricopeptide repeat protein, partial [Anaeromyxobacteraceae bacterium]|nr:tetratricopeptide repeat protein [Anaeromyxobacteraceae bacterium]